MRTIGISLAATLWASATMAAESTGEEPSSTALAPSEVETTPTPINAMHLSADTSDFGKRTFHRHDGGYLRVNWGAGSSHISFSSVANRGKLSLSGFSTGVDVLAGFSPSEGFALGGGLSAVLTPAASPDRGESVSMTTGIIGPFVDGFPNASGGWHWGALAGLALGTAGNDAIGSGVGFGGNVWAGYGAWVGPDVSVGALLKIMGSQLYYSSDQDDSSTGGGFGWLIAFTVLYH